MCVLFVSCRSPPRASTVQQAWEQTERGPALSGCSCCPSLLLLFVVVVCLLLLLLMCCRCFGNCQQEPCVSTPLLVWVEQPGRKKKVIVGRALIYEVVWRVSWVRDYRLHIPQKAAHLLSSAAQAACPQYPRARLHGECDSLLHCALKAGLRLATTANRGFDW